jgi:hypothetical protein
VAAGVRHAERPDDVRRWLPGGGGHVLITSREHVWGEIAATVEMELMPRPDSVALLRGRVAELGQTDAARLAEHLGDLQLAVAQAAGFMAETGVTRPDTRSCWTRTPPGCSMRAFPGPIRDPSPQRPG